MRGWALLASAVLSFGGLAPARADPPVLVGRAVYVEGHVQVRAGGSELAALVNDPAAAGEAFSTGPDGRIELQTPPALVRLDRQSAVEIAEIGPAAARVQVLSGTVLVGLDAPGTACAILAGADVVELAAPGRYRIRFDPGDSRAGGRLEVSVISGLARIGAGPKPLEAPAGRAASLTGPSGTAVLAALAPIPFDQWSRARDRAEAAAAKRTAYANPELVGERELANYGGWITTALYGPVWRPARLAADWVPYRDGRWIRLPPWGWTWVDDQPWGFVTSHFGRWVRIDGLWAWRPGAPVYAPALVAFAAGWSDVLAGRREPHRPLLAWTPLAPGEFYRPPYPASPGYLVRLNAAEARLSRGGRPPAELGGYRNFQAASVAPLAPLAAGVRASKVLVRVDRDRLARSPVVAGPDQAFAQGRAPR